MSFSFSTNKPAATGPQQPDASVVVPCIASGAEPQLPSCARLADVRLIPRAVNLTSVRQTPITTHSCKFYRFQVEAGSFTNLAYTTVRDLHCFKAGYPTTLST
jgi:hypothetical protein